ncbi:hypothetical protein CVD28_05545 [Bacillus sp. M6-12]|uniref:riboflavin kinase n=1 Tax=Bacillus sp. M6-12 TaxID=2054166 RepID=UPI000C77FE7C|nr:riboflavin kinase [Bacillus sp. M6-12]PLS18603.1 hypothetical protein CVD28_05545 [Bacillus sp. M6-12]
MNTPLCSLHGVVIKGRQIGGTIGFPTANLSLISKKPNLEHGVYGVIGYWNQHQLFGVMNIGVRPTFHDTREVSYEVHFFDFNDQIYDEELYVDVLFFVRPELSFSKVEELIQQIHQDVAFVKRSFSSQQSVNGCFSGL